jgi:hypothetical protein
MRTRTWVSALAALVVLFAAYWGWALVGAAQLASAASRGDAAALMQRVDAPLLTRSLSGQIAAAYLKENPKFARLSAVEQGFVRSAGVAAVNAVLAELLTPQNVAALLDKGRAALPAGTPGGEPLWQAPSLTEAFRSGALKVAANSGFDGPLSFVVRLDSPDGPYGVHLRLGGATWRLSGLDVPEAVSARLAREVARRAGGFAQGDG